MAGEFSSSRHGRAGLIVALAVAACLTVTLAATASARASSWSLEQTPPPVGESAFDAFSAVSCPSATRCIAVGAGPGAKGTYPLVDVWNGSSWSATELDSGYDHGAPLLGVSCPSATNCIAVGYGMEEGPMWPVAEVLSGTGWNEETLPFPAHPEQPSYTQSELNAISCAPGNVCTAVGVDHYSPQPLIEQLRDGQWTIQSAPAGVDGETELLAVSCLSGSNCTAVGDSGGHALIDFWNGTSWTVQQSTDPGAATASYLNGVSCTYNLHCTAVGSQTVNGVVEPLIETRTSTTWKAQSAPVPAGGQNGELNAVKCRTDSGCEAVGSYFDSSSGETMTLIEHQLYVKWGVQPSPKPPATSINALTGVTCPTATLCQAVGTSDGDTLLAEIYAPG